MSSKRPEIQAADLRRGIPFPDATFDVVYHSHVLEHFRSGDGARLISECFRVLKPGGILRVAVPDLEEIVKAYLSALAEARAEKPGAFERYTWMKLELFDQISREKSGGEMQEFLASRKAEAFVSQRLGAAAQIMANANQPTPGKGSKTAQRRSILKGFWCDIKSPKRWREAVLRRLLGHDEALFQIGRFRRSGEVHLCMYDSYSLRKLLEDNGFFAPRICSAKESAIPDWESYSLDTEPDGTVYKADSLFMEATRPS